MKSFSKPFTTNKGFTLIELMITVAIVGILASVAVPSYKEYLVRARVAEMVNIASIPKITVAEDIMFGATTTDGETFGGLASEFVASVTYTGGAIVVTGQNLGEDAVANPAGGNFALTLSFTATEANGVISWTCAVSNAGYNKYVPRNCQI